jgi:PhzF family phenazine biosynthesis protein
MKLSLYQVDAFTDKLFSGNPAAVIPLDKWIDEELMQKLAMENNLAETVFFVPLTNGEADYHIRWFTPAAEINLCGHATLASAYVLYEILGFKKPFIVFDSLSGKLKISKEGSEVFKASMDFPAWMPERADKYPENLKRVLGIEDFVAVYKNRELIVELDSEKDVLKAKPDFALMRETGYKMIITAPGKDVDFVSRFFAPTYGIDEDPVTGSAHSQLIPFWGQKLGKKIMKAKQLSQRGGDLDCEWKGDRVSMGGACVFYMKGEIEIGDQ